MSNDFIISLYLIFSTHKTCIWLLSFNIETIGLEGIISALLAVLCVCHGLDNIQHNKAYLLLPYLHKRPLLVDNCKFRPLYSKIPNQVLLFITAAKHYKQDSELRIYQCKFLKRHHEIVLNPEANYMVMLEEVQPYQIRPPSNLLFRNTLLKSQPANCQNFVGPLPDQLKFDPNKNTFHFKGEKRNLPTVCRKLTSKLTSSLCLLLR